MYLTEQERSLYMNRPKPMSGSCCSSCAHGHGCESQFSGLADSAGTLFFLGAAVFAVWAGFALTKPKKRRA